MGQTWARWENSAQKLEMIAQLQSDNKHLSVAQVREKEQRHSLEGMVRGHAQCQVFCVINWVYRLYVRGKCGKRKLSPSKKLAGSSK